MTAFLRLLYRHKEKIILGLMIIAFAVVGYLQWKTKKDNEAGGKDGKSPEDIVLPGGKKGAPPREPESPSVPPVSNEYPLETYLKLVSGTIFVVPAKEGSQETTDKAKQWAQIKVKSVFDATRSGSFIAIIEVDNRRSFVKEGETFNNEYTVQRIDGVRSCLTIVRRGEQGEREFCKEEEK